jgi:hypothetical protein
MVNPYEKRWFVGACHGVPTEARINLIKIFNRS